MMSGTTIAFDEWLSVLEQVYLGDFVASGGAAVKFLAPRSGLLPAEIVTQLRQAAGRAGYAFAEVSSGTTKVHLIRVRLF